MQAKQRSVYDPRRRRAVVAIQVAVFAVILVGFAALTFDIGAMYSTRSDHQRTADAAALAAAARLSQYEDGSPLDLARQVAQEFTENNKVFGDTITIDPNSDVTFGRAHYDSATNFFAFTPTDLMPDAVDYMSHLIDDMDSDDQPSLEIYGTTARHEVDLSHDPLQVGTRIVQMQAGHYNSWTNTGAGIYEGINELTGPRGRTSARKVIVLLRDGNAHGDAGNNCGSTEDDILIGNQYAIDAATDVGAQGIRIIAVSVGADANTALMQQIADITSGEHSYASGTIDEYSATMARHFRADQRKPTG